ncbi:hypothetical protein Cgig2_005749 [Carnegiea gigantea]|uniref:RNase H type-1 domain-containing protein n=1 Tax=Carnegiea gigantea TaxID=171969 RepID=A0A9Q1KH08_9CARY|nr:hypothetical protein Cgig2_016483 [Carnegiea gigantea]KAJ8443198.1 hypothetical protein Cgig2_005749 [Carnegiea gigantea]
MNCVICGFDCESGTHILLHCPLTKWIWEGTSFKMALANPVSHRERLCGGGNRCARGGGSGTICGHHLGPPPIGILKLNFDGGKVGEDSWGGGFLIRSFDGDVVMANTQQGTNFAGPTIEETRAYLSGLQSAHDQGFLSLVVEGDCVPLIQKL